jgi:hypothetical protein
VFVVGSNPAVFSTTVGRSSDGSTAIRAGRQEVLVGIVDRGTKLQQPIIGRSRIAHNRKDREEPLCFLMVIVPLQMIVSLLSQGSEVGCV